MHRSAQGYEAALTPVRVLTDSCWLVGKLVAPAQLSFADYLDRAPEFLSLTDVILEGRPKTLPLFALHRDAIVFMLIETDQPLVSSKTPKDSVEHAISCLIAQGSLVGTMRILRGVRLSDYLSKNTGFVVVEDCHYRIRDPWSREVLDHRERAILLNTQAVIGISESS